MVAEGTSITYTVTDKDSGAELWRHTEINDEWALGSFGFRARVMDSGLTNLYMVGFDNLKITAIGEVGDHLAAGKALADYKPNVTSAAVEPLLTPAIEVTVPDVVEVSVSDLDMTKTEYVFMKTIFPIQIRLPTLRSIAANGRYRMDACTTRSLRRDLKKAPTFRSFCIRQITTPTF